MLFLYMLTFNADLDLDMELSVERWMLVSDFTVKLTLIVHPRKLMMSTCHELQKWRLTRSWLWIRHQSTFTSEMLTVNLHCNLDTTICDNI